ncbi:unnamed protein product, partial [Ectocarpus sp. 8 AP-2014]
SLAGKLGTVCVVLDTLFSHKNNARQTTRVIFARAARNRSEFDGLCWEAGQRRRELRRGRTATAEEVVKVQQPHGAGATRAAAAAAAAEGQ